MATETKTILVTGGSGFIGSHCLIELANDGYDLVVADDCSNSSEECIRRVEGIIGKKIQLHRVDINDYNALSNLFKTNKFYAVLHLAAFKSVGESVEKPLKYYSNNVGGTVNVLRVMSENNCFNFVFSSSATVYGLPKYLPLDEKHATIGYEITNPYGKSKYMVEHVLTDLCKTDKRWNVIILRYFNPVGAHKSGLIGEDPQGPPANLMPFVSQVAIGRRPAVNVFGNDYDTPDGTGVRDYIHISDLATGHSCAVTKLSENPGLKIYNLGTGNGYSVLDMIRAMEKASGRTIAYNVCPRRSGDIASVYADASLANVELNWKATRGLDEMCEDLWRWQENNPNGFAVAN